MPPDEAIAPGTVWLVGAGPGDPDLLTRKAERLIAAADILFHDALVGPAILDFAAGDAERVSVGKRSGRHSKPQASINDLLIEAALAGKRVVRLKGGDPSLFGRSAEELDALREAGIPAWVCPGITTASAAAASAGISLSLRGVARRVQFVTAHSQRGTKEIPAGMSPGRRAPRHLLRRRACRDGGCRDRLLAPAVLLALTGLPAADHRRRAFGLHRAGADAPAARPVRAALCGIGSGLDRSG
jgi:precorrin-6B methylase 1